MPVWGCWLPATREMVVYAPKGFCDLNAVNTIGHEFMHVIGWKHGEDHLTPYFNSTLGCSNGKFVVQ